MSDLLERKMLDLPDGQLSYLAGPHIPGRPSLNIIHATGFNANTYRQILEPLSAQLNVYAIDLRGHGLGTLNNDPKLVSGSWEIYRQDFYKFLDFINEPIYLMGHSVGSIVSLAGAVKHQNLVRGMMLTEAVIPAYGRTAENPYNVTEDPLPDAARRRRKHFPSREVAVDNYVGKGAFQTWGRQWISDYIDGGTRILEDGTVELSCDPEWEATSFESAEGNPWEMFKVLTCPMTLMHGQLFSTCEPSGIEYFKELQPAARVISVPGASHFLPMEKSELVIEAVLELVERGEAAAR